MTATRAGSFTQVYTPKYSFVHSTNTAREMDQQSEALLANANDLISQLQGKVKALEEKLAVMEDTAGHGVEKPAKGRTEGTRLTKSAGKEISEDEGRIGML